MSIGVLERAPKAEAKLGIIDCDIHPAQKSPAELTPFLSQRWQDHLKNFGHHYRQPFAFGLPYPRFGDGNRVDARAPDGSFGGSDLAFMQAQHLDANDIAYGVLQPLGPNAQSQRNLEFGAALCGAVNDWQVAKFCSNEPRLKASLVVPQEDAEASAKEIARRSGDRNFVQVSVYPRGIEPLGRRRYWPIFAAAVEHGMPMGLHVGGMGGMPSTGSGWASYYLEDHHTTAETMQALVVSLVLEGVFEEFKDLKFILIEGGFVWLPALAWRLDKHWHKLKAEVPHLKRAPSEYIREHFWFTTQPIDEPQKPQHLRETIDWIGWDRILFSTDYPHWDFDDPKHAFKIRLSEQERAMIFRDNAAKLYGLD